MAILKLKNKTTGEWEEIQAIIGNGIASIEKTSTSGLVDTYTITYTNGNTTTFNVTNGEITREELEEEVERLSMIYNAFPSTTGEGEEPSINGTAEVPFKEIGLKGNTSQESTTGKNLLPNNATTQTIRGITFTINEDKSITLNGTNDNTGSSTLFLITEADNFSLNAGTYNSIATGVSGVNIGAYDGTNYYTFAGGSGDSITLQNNKSFASVYLQVSKGNSTTFNNNKIYPILSLTPVSESDYEPYTGGIPAPNPDNPQEIHCTTGENQIKVVGKNLVDIESDTKTINNYYYDNTSLGFTITEDMVDKKMSFSFDIEISNLTSSATVMYGSIGYGDNNFATNWGQTNYSNISAGKYNMKIESRTITSAMIGKKLYVRFLGFNQPSSATYNATNIQLEEGSTATSYTPYEETTYPINLGSMELCKIGDYQDYLYKDSGKWYKYGAIGKHTITDSDVSLISTYWLDSYGVYGAGILKSKFNLSSTSTDKESLCNVSRKINGQLKEENTYAFNNNANYVFFFSSAFDTTEHANAILVGANVYYNVDTPTITEITDTTLIEQLDNLEKAYSYDTQTNISQTNQDKPFIISYEAILSLRNVLNNLETRIAVLETE